MPKCTRCGKTDHKTEVCYEGMKEIQKELEELEKERVLEKKAKNVRHMVLVANVPEEMPEIIAATP